MPSHGVGMLSTAEGDRKPGGARNNKFQFLQAKALGLPGKGVSEFVFPYAQALGGQLCTQAESEQAGSFRSWTGDGCGRGHQIGTSACPEHLISVEVFCASLPSVTKAPP